MITVATSIWPMLTTKIRPPKTRNWLTWSTSLVTRETSAPRRSVFCVSSGRSWTWRKALTRSVASPRSEVVKSRLVMVYDARLVIASTTAQPMPEPHDVVEARAVGTVEPAVEGLLDGDRHDHLPAGGHDREEQREPEALAELGRDPHAAADGLDGADVLAGVHPGAGGGVAGRGGGAHWAPPALLGRGGPPALVVGRLLVGVDEAGVVGAAAQELAVGAAVGDPALVEVHHLVGEADGGLAVGDDDQGRVGGPLAQGGEDARLDLGVHRGRGVVEDQQARAPHQGAGQRDALALAAGERRAPLPQLGVQAVAERGDEAVGLRVAQRGPHHVVGDVGAEGDVAADGVVEEERRLRDQGHGPGELAARQVAQVDPVDADRLPRRGRRDGSAGWSGCSCRTRSGRPARPCGPAGRRRSRRRGGGSSGS